MSDSAPKRRPRFQFHFSTGIVLMLVAGGVIWVNLRVTTFKGIDESYMEFYRNASIGWPYEFLSRYDAVPATIGGAPLKAISAAEVLSAPAAQRSFEFTAFLDDLFIGLLILALAFGAWEGILRVRAFLAAAEEVESGG